MNVTDFTYLRRATGGDRELTQQLAEIFGKQTSEFEHGMETALHRGDFEGAARLTHKTRSSLAALGMGEAVQTLTLMEERCRGNAVDVMRMFEDIRKVAALMRQANEEIRQLC